MDILAWKRISLQKKEKLAVTLFSVGSNRNRHQALVRVQDDAENRPRRSHTHLSILGTIDGGSAAILIS